MIIKTFEIEKLKKKNVNFFLLYGDNEGFKNQVFQEIFANNSNKKIQRVDENEILNNFDNFIESIVNKSGLNHLFSLDLYVSWQTIPWVKSPLNGSLKLNLGFLWAIACIKNLEYNKCNIACSTPPIYWSTGIQYLISSELNP